MERDEHQHQTAQAIADAPDMADRLRALADVYYEVLGTLDRINGRVAVREVVYQLRKRGGIEVSEDDVRTTLQLLESEGLAVSTEYQVTADGRLLLDVMT